MCSAVLHRCPLLAGYLTHLHPASIELASRFADDAYERLSPDGLSLNGSGGSEGWLEHHVRKMCKALRPEVGLTWQSHPTGRLPNVLSRMSAASGRSAVVLDVCRLDFRTVQLHASKRNQHACGLRSMRHDTHAAGGLTAGLGTFCRIASGSRLILRTTYSSMSCAGQRPSAASARLRRYTRCAARFGSEVPTHTHLLQHMLPTALGAMSLGTCCIHYVTSVLLPLLKPSKYHQVQCVSAVLPCSSSRRGASPWQRSERTARQRATTPPRGAPSGRCTRTITSDVERSSGSFGSCGAGGGCSCCLPQQIFRQQSSPRG
jgi:hypothetical protein